MILARVVDKFLLFWAMRKSAKCQQRICCNDSSKSSSVLKVSPMATRVEDPMSSHVSNVKKKLLRQPENRTKGATEAAWRNDKATIELNWNRTKAPVDRAILSVRESINSTHNVLQRTRWQDTLPQAASRMAFPDTSAFPPGSSFDKLMATYQLASEQTSTAGKDVSGKL